jgi:hypothetical protein
MTTPAGAQAPRELRTAQDGGHYWLVWRCRPPASGIVYEVVRDQWDEMTGPLPTRYVDEIRIAGIVD